MSHTNEPDPDAGSPPDVLPVGTTASLTVGAEGGSLTLGALALDIPAGAVAPGTEVRVTVDSAPVPSSFTGFSPRFRFEPDGLTFERPVTARLPFTGDAATATVFWTTRGGASFAPLPTTIDGSVAVAQITHFSSAFVGTACTGEDCCGRANGDLDVLFMIDNSNSMHEEQAALAEQLPRMARVLATGDLDGDGTQDFPALRSVRIGTVTSDMGVGGFHVPTCARGDFGDDGILRREGRFDLGCDATYPSYAELRADDPSASVDGFVEHVSCVAQLGIGGCGFEQQLEAVLKALTPSTSPVRFVSDTTGHADGANAGFQRADSILAAILLTDEEDCSASDPRIFDPSSPVYGATDLNLRCFQYGDMAVHPVSRYVDGLRALRSDPADVVFAAIAGVPVDLVSDPSAIDYDALLSDPRMEEVLDPVEPNRLRPSCVTPAGMAFPPRRLVETARGFGANGVVQSICQSDFTPVIDAVLTRVAARVSGACGE
jgi:hypothetical protein